MKEGAGAQRTRRVGPLLFFAEAVCVPKRDATAGQAPFEAGKEKQHDMKSIKLTWKSCLMIGVTVFLLYLAIFYWPTVSALLGGLLTAGAPLLAGFFIAYIINLLMSFYERLYFPKKTVGFWAKSRRPVCLIGAILTAALIIAVVVGLVLPELIDCIQLILALLPDMFTTGVKQIDEWGILPENVMDLLMNIDWKTRINQIIDLFSSGIGGVMNTLLKTLTAVFSGAVTVLLSVIFACYLLIGKDRLLSQTRRVARRYLKESWYQKLGYVIDILNKCFHRFIVGQCTEAVILGLLCTAGMLIFRFPYATMIGALVAFTALIPVAGAYIGAGVGAFMILTVSPVKALLFLVFILVLQQLEGNLIYPRVVGSSMGLPGIWVLAAVTVGGGISGVLGMLLGVPITAALYCIVRDDMNGRGLRAVGVPSPCEKDVPPCGEEENEPMHEKQEIG